MFPVNFEILIFIYLGVFLTAVILLWFFFDRRRRNVDYSINTGNLWECPVCGHKYVDSKNARLAGCPRCGSINEKEDLDDPDLYG